jgi:hypothetical protein
MSDYFLLDPDYKDFPEKQKLKFLTVYDESHTFIVVAVLSVCMLSIATYEAIFGGFLPEMRYIMWGTTTQAIITQTCQLPHRTYTYGFDVITLDGETKHYVGKTDRWTSETCPKQGDLVTVDYIQDQPEDSRVTEYAGTRLAGMIILALLPIYAYIWIREQLECIWAFIKARPKYNRLKDLNTLIDGVITRVDKAPKPKFAGRWHGYYIEVEYEFTTNSHLLRGKQAKRREDLRGKRLPAVGTPVHILYADDDTYLML